MLRWLTVTGLPRLKNCKCFLRQFSFNLRLTSAAFLWYRSFCSGIETSQFLFSLIAKFRILSAIWLGFFLVGLLFIPTWRIIMSGHFFQCWLYVILHTSALHPKSSKHKLCCFPLYVIVRKRLFFLHCYHPL